MNMRAKVKVGSVMPYQSNGVTTQETVMFYGVSKNKYDETGLDEDNTFAKFSPSVFIQITIANPVLLDQFNPGDIFYLDFINAEK